MRLVLRYCVSQLNRFRGDHLVRGSLTVLAGSILAAVSGYVFWTYLSRRFGAEAVGEVSALGGAAAVVSLLHARSVGASVLSRSHTIPLDARRALVGALVVLVGPPALLLASFVAVVLRSTGVSTLADPALFSVYIVGVAAQSVGATFDAAALAARSPGLVALRNGASSVLRLPLLAASSWLAASLAGAGAALVASSLVAVGGSFWLARRLVSGSPRSGGPGLREVTGLLLRGVRAQALVAFGTCVPAQVLPVLVVVLAGTAAGGHFSMAWLVGSTCFMVAPMVCASLLTEGSRDEGDLSDKVRRASLLIGALLLPPAFLYLLAGRRVLSLFGDGFSDGGGLVLAFVVLAAAPNAALNVSISVLRVRERLRAAAAASLLGGCSSLAVSAALLPSMGAPGAGAGWFVGQLAGAAFGLRAVFAGPARALWPSGRGGGRWTA